jgi:anti-sigma regulatory factor (Ser/Thr protein kinase)
MRQLVSLGRLADELGVSGSWVRTLTNRGLLPVTLTQGGHRRYDLEEARAAFARLRSNENRAPGWSPDPGNVNIPRPSENASTRASSDSSQERVDERFDALGLDESQVWKQVAHALNLEPTAASTGVARYAFTEMLNNAIDHASASTIGIRVTETDTFLGFEISDDGVGVFAHLAAGLGLRNDLEAVAELTKGKRTTDPARHSGEGIFFTSKAVTTFALKANGIEWLVDNAREDLALGASEVSTGTIVQFSIDRRSSTTTAEVFARFTRDHQFVRSSPVIRLFEIDVDFVSRSEAKRLLTGMESFEEITLDFSGVQSVGQGFVDEVFRVWLNSHPSTLLTPINMNAEVDFMIKRGLARAAEL